MTERNYIRTQPKLNFLDWIVGGSLLILAWDKGTVVLLLAVIVAGLYFFARPHLFKVTRAKTSATQPQENSVDSESEVFVVNQDEEHNCVIDVDVDLRYRPCKNHLRLYSRFDIYVSNAEFEFKIEGTNVFTRILNDQSVDPGEPEYCDILDGVVQEAAIREREERQRTATPRVRRESIEEKITGFRKQTEWAPLNTTGWNGFKYFLLARELPEPDSRRYFREELERLMRGEKVFIEAASKLGYEPREGGKYFPKGYRVLNLMAGREEPSEEQSKLIDLPGVLASVNLTMEEFGSSENLRKQLHQLLGDKS